MSFLLPWGWAWLTSGLVVVALYLLRRREREEPVSALFLWERIPRSGEPHGTAARPVRPPAPPPTPRGDPVRGRPRPPHRPCPRTAGATAIVLDGSASMAATGRADAALAEARRLIGDSSGPWSVVVWADPPRVLVPRTANREEVLALLGAYRPTLGARPPLGEALALLPSGFGRTVVITDDPPRPRRGDRRPPALDNLAIVAFAARSTPTGRVRGPGAGPQ